MRIFTLGEAMVRLSPWAPGEGLSGAFLFRAFVGGSELNLACALSQLGHEAVWVSKLPDDPLGRRVLGLARSLGVDTSGVVLSQDAQIGVYFADPWSSLPEVVYVRRGSAFSTIGPEEVDWSLLGRSDWVHLTGITPALGEGPREAWLEALKRARASGKGISLDINYRSELWSEEEARRILAPEAKRAEVLFCSLEDAVFLFGAPSDPELACGHLKKALGAKVVALKAGEARAFAADEEGRVLSGPSFNVPVRDPIGAGDAFSAGFLHGFWEGGVKRGLEWGSALSALKCGALGDTFRFTEAEVRRLLEEGESGDGS